MLPEVKNQAQAVESVVDYSQLDTPELKKVISIFDMKRLESYSKNLVDFHLVVDMIP